ncbi:hypothetical protein y223_00033 [Bordetella phage PY223]
MNQTKKPRATFRVNPNDPPPNWPDEVDPTHEAERKIAALYVLLGAFIVMWAVVAIMGLIAHAAA